MEIPFDYILISIMINLKNRKVKAEVSKQSLIKIINKIIYNLNVNEKEKLEIINKEVDGDNETSFRAIYFDIDTQILLDRIIHRQSCPVCGEIYNKKFKPSKVENMCDKCHVELKTRADDNAETAKARFDTYFEQTAPLRKFYEDKDVLYKIDANGSIDEVWERLLKVVND